MGLFTQKAKTSLFLVVSVLHRTKIKKQMLAFNRLVEKDMIGVGCLEAEYPFFFFSSLRRKWYEANDVLPDGGSKRKEFCFASRGLIHTSRELIVKILKG
jgi:hypothetical protein